MFRRIVSLALSIMLGMFSYTAFAAADTPSASAEKEVNAAIAAKLVPQSLQSKYTQPATRAEFCALAVSVYESIKGKTITERKTFADTKDINIEKAGGIGVATSLGDNKFYPAAKITREHVAIMTARLAKALGKELPKKAAAYEDKASISTSAVESVGQVQAAGLMLEAGGKKFAPKDPYTREQSIITMMRTYNAVKGVTGTTDPTKPTATPTTATAPPVGSNKLVGRWLCHYSMVDSVFFFDEDGTFIMATIRLPSYAVVHNVEHFKGNYRLNDDKLEFTNLYRYSNDLAGWRDVPLRDLELPVQTVLDIQKIIKTGTRAEVESLLDPDNPYYHQPSNQGWKSFDARTGDIVFHDQDNMQTNIFGAFNEYERVVE